MEVTKTVNKVIIAYYEMNNQGIFSTKFTGIESVHMSRDIWERGNFRNMIIIKK